MHDFLKRKKRDVWGCLGGLDVFGSMEHVGAI